MVQPRTHYPNQLVTDVDCLRVRPLVVTPVPLLRASFHLSRVVGRQGQMLETMMSGHRPRGNVEQAVVYSTSTTGLSTLTFRGEVVASGGGVEERSEVIYCIEEDMYI